MKKIIYYLRIKEWLSSKVTMMMGVFVYFLYICKTEITAALAGLLVYFLFLSSFLAISYIANDYSDIEVDKKAGKKKVIAEMEKWQIWLSLVLIFFLGNVPLLIYCQNKIIMIIFLIVTYLLGIAYSALPNRLVFS